MLLATPMRMGVGVWVGVGVSVGVRVGVGVASMAIPAGAVLTGPIALTLYVERSTAETLETASLPEVFVASAVFPSPLTASVSTPNHA